MNLLKISGIVALIFVGLFWLEYRKSHNDSKTNSAELSSHIPENSNTIYPVPEAPKAKVEHSTEQAVDQTPAK